MQFHIVHLDHMCSDVLVPTSPEETPTVIHQVVELDQWPGPLSMPTYKEEGSMEHPINIDLPDPTLESLLLMHSNCIIDPAAEYLLSVDRSSAEYLLSVDRSSADSFWPSPTTFYKEADKLKKQLDISFTQTGEI